MERGAENVSDEIMAKIFWAWDFPGGPVFPLQGAQVSKLDRELFTKGD